MPSKYILIVDDDPGVQEAIKDALEDEGHKVTLAGDGADALAQIRGGRPPDLILLDHMMPVMDGPTFVVEMQSDPALRGVPIVLLTADARADDKAAAMGVTSFLRKPLQLKELLAIVDDA
jgi:CheY-like chemotaxis protein